MYYLIFGLFIYIFLLKQKISKESDCTREQIMSYPITDNTFNEFFADEKPIITKYQPIS